MRGSSPRDVRAPISADLGQIGADLGVTRERVRQWKLALGKEVRTYLIHPEVINIMGAEEEKENKG